MAYYAVMTNTGRNKEAAALANGAALEITQIAWGDGNRSPGGGETALLNEIGRKEVQGTGLVDGALDSAFFEILLDANEGPYVIREAGLFDTDGDLIAIAAYDPPVNKPKDTATALIRIHVVFSDLKNLILKVQSTDAYVPVERTVIAGPGAIGGGDLSGDIKIGIDFATIAAAETGAANDKVISPALLAALIGPYTALRNATVLPGRYVWSSDGVLMKNATGTNITINGRDSAALLVEGLIECFPAQQAETVGIAAPVGAIMGFAIDSPPPGWLECNGAGISRTSYAELFAAIGTRFGTGDRVTRFNLPDLRGEFLRGWDHNRGADAGRVFGSAQKSSRIRSLIDYHSQFGESTLAVGGWELDGPVTGIPATGIKSNTPLNNREYYRIGEVTVSNGSGDNTGMAVRPRNVALMFCIKY